MRYGMSEFLAPRAHLGVPRSRYVLFFIHPQLGSEPGEVCVRYEVGPRVWVKRALRAGFQS